MFESQFLIWLHLCAMAAYVGAQFAVIYMLIPAAETAPDEAARRKALIADFPYYQLKDESRGAVMAGFVYDALGRRASKRIGLTTTQFLYDGLNSIHELDASNTPTENLLTGLRIDERFTRTDVPGGASANFLTDNVGTGRAATARRAGPSPPASRAARSAESAAAAAP